ncbi:hypothetical protein FZ934_06400 [Rhizobium grahamii]|uniref:Transmembrane anchored protein n=2 Tax=Rhizobium TaxID=379 RepID=A0A5Q0C3K2_9HYPH|nr:hypothetical protein FZ934_06400 [Rhizobium grahamii]QRM50790.1 hypothetical protein F3Y33_16495 [Rhizobium sp. BG6]
MFFLPRSFSPRTAMHHSAETAQPLHETPLLSMSLLLRAMALIATLAALTLAISIGGRWIGERISLAGNTDSVAPVTLTIGRDTLEVPANAIRFSSQRKDGVAERADLYLTWPQMQGYTKDNRDRFDDISQSSGLIFMQITQSTMSRDMSGRLEPIYNHLVDGKSETFGAGMTLHHFRADAGYPGEVLLTAPRVNGDDYVVRCMLPATAEAATSGDCQRDIKVGRDLSVLYRFSSQHLPDWDHIDAAIRHFVEARLVTRSDAGR